MAEDCKGGKHAVNRAVHGEDIFWEMDGLELCCGRRYNSVIQGVVARLEPRLEATINDAVSSGFQRLQSVFLPPLPLPEYSAHHLCPISDIRPHASHLQQFRDSLGIADFVYRYPEQAILVEKVILRDGHVLIIMRCGSGKTFFVLLYVELFSQGRQIIFILPHSGLHEDLRGRANELQIPDHDTM
ncbi:hypothetical protein C8R44DRAFT_895227 [Mycena epipterygia]|nr:hypothetical protein C8R44DRAFT_895227 [Mycena epipterygia]